MAHNILVGVSVYAVLLIAFLALFHFAVQRGKKQSQGFSMLEMVIVLAVLALLTGALGQSLISVVQARNEKNISATLLQFQTAEQAYKNKGYNGVGYATNWFYLSTCTPNTAPSATAACLLPAEWTHLNESFGYTLSTIDPPDQPTCSAGPCGFLITAVPSNTAAGRFTYCVGSNDSVLHGALHQSSTISTLAECDALPIIALGAPGASSPPNPPVLDNYNNCTGASCSTTITAIPNGAYEVIGQVVVSQAFYVSCSTTPPSVGYSAYNAAGESSGTGVNVVTITDGTMTLNCGGNGNGNIIPSLMLVPVSGVTVQ